jgi:hypothetical protein
MYYGSDIAHVVQKYFRFNQRLVDSLRPRASIFGSYDTWGPTGRD